MTDADLTTSTSAAAAAPEESTNKRKLDDSVSSTDGGKTTGDTGYASGDEDNGSSDTGKANDVSASCGDGKKKKKTTTKKNKAKQTNFSKLGRRGDPRMHKAVIGRLQNPELSLLDALKFGGFVFPALDVAPANGDKEKQEDGNIVDSENVTLGQRKNQLSRRLRIAREKGTGAGDVAAQYAKECGIDIDSVPVAVSGKKRSKKRSKKSKAGEDASMASVAPSLQLVAAALQGNGMGAAEQLRQLSMLNPNNPPPLPGVTASIAGLPDSAPEVIIEDADADPTVSGASGRTVGTKKAKDHPMFAQYQASLLNNSSHWGGLHNVMASVAANQAMAANAGLAALGAAAGAHARVAQDAQQAIVGAAALQQAGLGWVPQVSSSVPTAAASSVDADMIAAGAAPDSLSVTAASLGMSREQLGQMMGQGDPAKNADAEHKDADPEGTVKSDPNGGGEEKDAVDETKLNVALGIYQTEHSSLIKRCLLIGGFEPSKTEECDPLYLRFCTLAAKVEKKRLERLGACFQGRHVHRLHEKCGHKAIIHHPPGDEKPHVDFIVDGKVECYQGVSGVKCVDNEALWPSKFFCEDISCGTGGGAGDHKKHDDVTCGNGKCEKKCTEAAKKIKPAILDVSEKELKNHSEWSPIDESFLLDDSILGLVPLTGDGDGDGDGEMKAEFV
eukprot:CAMPEP_0178700924 /NCGR_PEP_ID=MMETSP0699-20121125/11956_1 /TAXON_ID=265572 /ORGANISM="Extubocellulus spinifer, Strain CCMP396" /LENGTH=672 /DNA_ID=CAMNT_0020347337 /DNA_START=17 /DNA_END=2035 /DNA_ORIENTATION=-